MFSHWHKHFKDKIFKCRNFYMYMEQSFTKEKYVEGTGPTGVLNRCNSDKNSNFRPLDNYYCDLVTYSYCL